MITTPTNSLIQPENLYSNGTIPETRCCASRIGIHEHDMDDHQYLTMVEFEVATVRPYILREWCIARNLT